MTGSGSSGCIGVGDVGGGVVEMVGVFVAGDGGKNMSGVRRCFGRVLLAYGNCVGMNSTCME